MRGDVNRRIKEEKEYRMDQTKSIWRRFLDLPLVRLKHGVITMENMPFILFHLSPIFVFFVPFQWELVWLAVGLYFLRMFFITGIYHRYFSHRGYEVRNRFIQFIMGFLGTTCVQQGPLWWAEHHRHHHRYSEKEEDLHSPVRYGFWQSHMLWFLLMYQNPHYSRRPMKDFEKFPELRWLDNYHVLGAVFLGVVLFAAGGAPYLVWGLCVSTVLLWHGTWTINSLTHVYGKKRFETGDESRNNWLLAIITLGEGWHNNHHAYQGGAKAGFYWYEYDVTYYVLWILQKIGIVTRMGHPPERVLALGRENDLARKEARKLVGSRILRRLTVEEVGLLAMAARKHAQHLIKDSGYFKKKKVEEIRQILTGLRNPSMPVTA